MALAFLASGPVSAQETVVRKVSASFLESVLKHDHIVFKKNAGKGFTSYAFKRNSLNMELFNYGGNDLLLVATFEQAPLSVINAWNVRAKFSRAVLYTVDGRSFSAVEMGLDCRGGVTFMTVQRFLAVFDNEARGFADLLRKADWGGPAS
jgi:hypothetical protein